MTGVSIIYANRNKDVNRITTTLLTLDKQSEKNFEVIFVDYGSEPYLVEAYETITKSFKFVYFYALEVSPLLWNKSKALNFGIKKATKPFVFIADVDLIFHRNTVELFNNLCHSQKFHLFPLNYLSQKESKKLVRDFAFSELKPIRKSAVNGMILASKKAFLEVWGLDEFFHFYGAEDEDLFARLENAGYEKVENDHNYFFHNWHPSFSGSEDKQLTLNPRMKNIMRINQRHFLRNRDKKLIRPLRQNEMGKVLEEGDITCLVVPDRIVEIKNIMAHVEHFIREELPSISGEVVRMDFVEDPYFQSLKYRLKNLMGKQTQPYYSMKEVNDIVLKEILYRYRDHIYSYKIAGNFKCITWCVKL